MKTYYYEISFSRKIYHKQKASSKLKANSILIDKCHEWLTKMYQKEFSFEEITKEEYQLKANDKTILS